MRKDKKIISALLLGIIVTGASYCNTVPVLAKGTTVIYQVHKDLTVGSGKEVTTIEREAAFNKKTNYAVEPLPQTNIIKIQNSSGNTAEKQVGSTLVVSSVDNNEKVSINTVTSNSFTGDFFDYVNLDKDSGKLGAKLTSPIRIESEDSLNGNTIQLQNLSLNESKLYYLETLISGTKDGEEAEAVTVYEMDKTDYESGIAEFTVRNCSDVDHVESIEITVVEFIPDEVEGATDPYIEVSVNDAEWIRRTGAQFDMESVASEHPRSITVPDSADIKGIAIPNVLTINYYCDGKVVFNGDITVNKSEITETQSKESDNKTEIVDDNSKANENPDEATDAQSKALDTDVLETVSTGAICYDTDGDSIDDVIIDSMDIRNLAVWISEINRKWTKNYKDEDKGLLDNISIVQGHMEEYKKEVSKYEELVK